MSNVKWFSILFVFSSLFLSANAYSSTVFSICETCSSSMSYEANARASAPQNGLSTVYVLNISNDTIKKFQSSYEQEINAVFVSELNVDPPTQAAFDDVVEARNSFWQALNGHAYIPESVASSAYGLVGASYIKNDVIAHWNQEFNLFSKSVTYVYAAMILSGEILNVPLRFEITFSDGSSAVLLLDSFALNGDFNLTVIEATDVDGNDISLVPTGYQSGEFRFTSGGDSAIQEFRDAAMRLGVEICDAGSCSSGFRTEMECKRIFEDEICIVRAVRDTVILH